MGILSYSEDNNLEILEQSISNVGASVDYIGISTNSINDNLNVLTTKLEVLSTDLNGIYTQITNTSSGLPVINTVNNGVSTIYGIFNPKLDSILTTINYNADISNSKIADLDAKLDVIMGLLTEH